jgi:hypothetical protein
VSFMPTYILLEYDNNENLLAADLKDFV